MLNCCPSFFPALSSCFILFLFVVKYAFIVHFNHECDFIAHSNPTFSSSLCFCASPRHCIQNACSTEETTCKILQHQHEGGTNHLVYRNQPEAISNSLIYQHRLEGGTNPLALPALIGRKHPLPKTQAPTY
jgi:hypothetical protein